MAKHTMEKNMSRIKKVDSSTSGLQDFRLDIYHQDQVAQDMHASLTKAISKVLMDLQVLSHQPPQMPGQNSMTRVHPATLLPSSRQGQKRPSSTLSSSTSMKKGKMILTTSQTKPRR